MPKEAWDIIVRVAKNEYLGKSFVIPNVFYKFKREEKRRRRKLKIPKTGIMGCNHSTKNKKCKMRI